MKPPRAVLARVYLRVAPLLSVLDTACGRGSILLMNLIEFQSAACGHVAHDRTQCRTHAIMIFLHRGRPAVTASTAVGSCVTAMGLTRLALISLARTQRFILCDCGGTEKSNTNKIMQY